MSFPFNGTVWTVLDSTGAPVPGAKVYTYDAGTLTAKAAYTTSALTTATSNPIIADSAGRVQFFLGSGSYRIRVFDASDVEITALACDNMTGITDISTQLAASSGSSLVGFLQSGTGAAARTAQAKMRDAVSVLDYGAVGDGVADDTTAIQNCYTANQGKMISHGDGKTYLISSSLTLYSGSTYFGRSIIKQKSGAGIAAPMLLGTSVSNVVLDSLEIDGNATGSAATQTYGVKFIGGTNNVVRGCNVHDTTQAGIYLASESYSKVIDNHVINCGRNLGTDNHGIMLISNTATPLGSITCDGNTVYNAYRKGITVYSATPGVVQGVSIVGNVVSGCLSGGIYVSNASAAVNGYLNGITISGNRCYNNYVNIEADCMNGGVVSGNSCDTTSGGQGIYSADCIYSAISNNSVISSKADGIYIVGLTVTPTGLSVTGNTVALSSQVGAGSYNGIAVNGVTYSNFSGNVVLGESSSPKQYLGINETGTSNNNLYALNRIAYTNSGSLVSFVGASNAYQTQTGNQTGINVVAPNNMLDIGGGMSVRDQAFALVNGANNNVTLPSNAGTLYVTGPTAIFNISGIAGGVQGRKLTIVNYTSFAMTVNFNSGSSSVGNRILIGGSADLAIATYGSVDLTYVAGASAWVVTGYKA